MDVVIKKIGSHVPTWHLIHSHEGLSASSGPADFLLAPPYTQIA